MPKLKSHSGTKKRIRITKNGKMLRGNAATHHFKRSQTNSALRAKSIDSKITGKIKKSIKRALGV